MRKRICALFFMLFFTALTIFPAMGLEDRASAQIRSYLTAVTPISSGDLEIYFLIEGIDIMDELGGEEITVYRHSGKNWVEVASYDYYDEGMVRSDSGTHNHTIVFDGTAGAEYSVVITIFAQDYDGGYDSRTRTHTVTAK